MCICQPKITSEELVVGYSYFILYMKVEVICSVPHEILWSKTSVIKFLFLHQLKFDDTIFTCIQLVICQILGKEEHLLFSYSKVL